MNNIDLANHLKNLLVLNPTMLVAGHDVAQLIQGYLDLWAEKIAIEDQGAELNKERNEVRRKLKKSEDSERRAHETWILEKSDLETKRKKLKKKLKDAGLDDSD